MKEGSEVNVQQLFKLSEAASAWVSDFDRTGIVMPASFELEVL